MRLWHTVHLELASFPVRRARLGGPAAYDGGVLTISQMATHAREIAADLRRQQVDSVLLVAT